MHLLTIRSAGFRNLLPAGVSWSRLSNLVAGANGQGKTNLLEAVTVFGNLRSFRVSSARRLVTQGGIDFVLDGRVETRSGAVRLFQRVTPGPPLRRELAINGAPCTVAQYLQVFPVVALSGADRDLVAGEPSARRSFLDRSVFLLEPGFFGEIQDYRRTLQQRNAALVNDVPDGQMEVWEARLAAAAGVLVHRRRIVCDRLRESFESIYRDLQSQDFPRIDLDYRGEAGLEQAEKVSEVEEHYRKRYNETRARDRRTGFTGEGPHRHDVSLRADGRAVRHMLSSGQTKVVAAALRLAALTQIEDMRGEHLPVIIDDVDAELDARVLSRLIEHLEGSRQLFLSTADDRVFHELTAGSSRLEIRQGTVVEMVGERSNE